MRLLSLHVDHRNGTGMEQERYRYDGSCDADASAHAARTAAPGAPGTRLAPVRLSAPVHDMAVHEAASGWARAVTSDARRSGTAATVAAPLRHRMPRTRHPAAPPPYAAPPALWV